QGPAPPTNLSADPGAAAASLAPLVGLWWSDTGVAYEAVRNGESVEFRLRDAEPLASHGYVTGDTHFALRGMPHESAVFRVAASIRPAPPKGPVYSPKARTTCEHTWRQSDTKKQLRAELRGDRLRVGLVRLEPPASTFVREGVHVVGCNNMADLPVTEA